MQRKAADVAQSRPLLAVLGLLRLLAVGLACFRLFGVAFFASTTQIAVAIPALVLLVLALTPIRFLSSKRVAIKLILGAYLLSYFFGGFQRILGFHQSMPDALEFIVVLCFCAFAWRQGQEPN